MKAVLEEIRQLRTVKVGHEPRQRGQCARSERGQPEMDLVESEECRGDGESK